MKKFYATSSALLITLLAMVCLPVYADRDSRGHRDAGKRPEKTHPDYRWDDRYSHHRQYPREGHKTKTLPERRHPIHYRGKNYFYFGGVWYLPSGPSFVVVRPPIGIVVPILPSFYTTIWIRGTAYYYANEVYYVWRPDLNGYQVTAPPPVESQAEPPYMADQLYIYPKQGQSEQQQADDRYACHRWGVDQSKYDPTQPPGNLPVSELSRLREDYNRAMKACLEGRGYSVR
jgi:hypothetical protein